MALNKYMHPSNRYKNNPPNFAELAGEFPKLKKHVKISGSGKGSVNFRDPTAIRELSKCLMQRDFGLNVELLEDRLAPTIPSRLNYILWVQDLLQCLPKQDSYFIYDIGCGCSCVYPLLGVKTYTNWKFVASEIDHKSFECAMRNVTQNNLCDKIKLVEVVAGDPVFNAIKGLTVDACICNPPFFSDADEIATSLLRPTANSSCSGSPNEMVFHGGDVAFCEHIVKESLKLKSTVKWYTTMLGKKSSLVALKKQLRKEQIPVVTSTEFCQGRTMRWGLAWSFIESVNNNLLPRSLFQLDKRKAKQPISIMSKLSSVQEAVLVIRGILNDLLIAHTTSSQSGNIRVTFESSPLLWINCRKRKRAKLWSTSAITSKTSKLMAPSNEAESGNLSHMDNMLVPNSSGRTDNITRKTLFQCYIDITEVNKEIYLNFSSASAERENVNRVAVYMKTQM